MKFTIEVEDFYLDEESQLAPALTHHIKCEVVNQISQSIKDRVEKQITMVVKAEVEQTMYRQIQSYVADTIATGRMPNGKGGEGILLSEYIMNIFQSNNSYSSPQEAIKALAKKYADEMKQRYDLLFASQLVAKMKENNMLKEDVAKMLLDK